MFMHISPASCLAVACLSMSVRVMANAASSYSPEGIDTLSPAMQLPLNPVCACRMRALLLDLNYRAEHWRRWVRMSLHLNGWSAGLRAPRSRPPALDRELAAEGAVRVGTRVARLRSAWIKVE